MSELNRSMLQTIRNAGLTLASRMVTKGSTLTLLAFMAVASQAVLALAAEQNASAAASDAESNFKIGVVENVPPMGSGKGNSEKLLDLHKYLGLKSVRVSIYWQQVEQQKGKLTLDRSFAAFENYLLQAKSNGIEPLFVLAYGNTFYDGGSFPVSDEAQDAFVRYVTFIANRFKGAVKYYEVWNEWNIGVGVPGRPQGDASVYTRLLKKAYPALKAVDPGIVVLAGATSGVDLGFATRVFQAGGLSAMDGFSVHPYVYPYGPERALPLLDRVEEEARKASGGREFPIYATEIGWVNVVGPKGSDEATVANYLSRVFLLFPTRSFMKGVWWFDRIDDGPDPQNGSHHFGLLRHDHSAKPAVCVLREVSKLLTDYKPISAQRQMNGVWQATFGNGSQFVHAVWTEEPNKKPNVTIEVPQSLDARITSRAFCQNAAAATAGGRSVTAVVSGSPLLLYTTAETLSIK